MWDIHTEGWVGVMRGSLYGGHGIDGHPSVTIVTGMTVLYRVKLGLQKFPGYVAEFSRKRMFSYTLCMCMRVTRRFGVWTLLMLP